MPFGARYWADRTADSRRRSYPRFRGQHTADVVVIGGGLTGCASAYALAAAGLDVVLVEAGRLASGGTAGGIGAIVPESDGWFRDVEPAAGRKAARAGWQEARKGGREFAAVLEKLDAHCDLAATALVINAPRQADVAALRKEQAARKAAGIDAPWVPADAARREISTDTYGAIRLRDTFVLDPVRAALALASAAESKGARIFERSAVTRTKFTRKDATVALTSGAIRTRGIVVATGEPGALFGQLRRHVRRRDGYVVVTAPLAAAMRRDAGPRKVVLTEAGAAPPWIRWVTEDRALVAGGLQAPVGPRLRDKALVQRTAELMYEFSLRYPSVSGLPANFAWSVPVVSTADGLPWIGTHRNYPFHFFAMALGWHGDALAWFAARAAARHFRGDARREDDILGFSRQL
jgi:glycine/D-amino acid oxidase-like deaminating enzyme